MKTPEPNRTIRKLPPPRPGEYRPCDFNPRVVGACNAYAEYVVIVPVATQGKRKNYTLYRKLCEEHLPRPRVSASEPPAEGLIPNQAAADILSVSVETLAQWRHRKFGPAWTKAKGRCWYDRAETERFAEALSIVKGDPR